MNRTDVFGYRRLSDRNLSCRSLPAFLVLLIASAAASMAQDASPKNSPLKATHLLGFTGAKDNATGTLSVDGGALQFQKEGKPAAQVKITSIQDVLLGDQSKQVGGLPMTLGKAAIPFSGGRAVSLFAHKKYDTLTLEYLDSDGGFHGAIFQLNKGQAEGFRDELVNKGARVSDKNTEPTKQTAEAASEKK